jgi:hypothetical protein
VGNQEATSDPWSLDPAKFPQRVDLELTDEVYAVLVAISERTGRSISEVAAEILSRDIHLHCPPPPRKGD